MRYEVGLEQFDGVFCFGISGVGELDTNNLTM